MALKKINAVIAGATGYVGLDLVKLLSNHSRVRIKYLCAQKNIGKNINYFDKRIVKKLPKISLLKKVKWSDIDVVFLSLPNGVAQNTIKKLFKFKNLKFIDLSADFRLKDPKQYSKWYKLNHGAKDLIKYSIYSISEFVKKDINKYRIISNPGCYPTSIQLALIPLLIKNVIKKDIIIDSKSGFSGAGKNYKDKFKYKNFDQSIHTYGIKLHRHMSELDQELNRFSKSKIAYTFNPQILPTFRGILSSIHLTLKKNISSNKILNILKTFHKKNRFIDVVKLNSNIGTGQVINTNRCQISVCESRYKNKIVIFSTLDNLVKGASGQAVQNMNLLYNFNEKEGL